MKRILALILAFVIFALALTGCKKPKNDDTSSTDSQTVTSEDTGSDISSNLGVLTSDTTTTTSKGTQNTVSNNPTQSVTTNTSNQTTVTSEDEVSIAPPPSEKLVLNKDFLKPWKEDETALFRGNLMKRKPLISHNKNRVGFFLSFFFFSSILPSVLKDILVFMGISY